MAISLPKVCSMGGSQTGLVGTIGVALLNPDGTVHTARATVGIYEIGGGCYGKNISFPNGWKGVLKWDTGGGSPVYAVEEYTTASEVWDEVLTGASHNIATSAGRRLRQSADVLIAREETCQAGGANNAVILDAGASAVDNFYLFDIIILTSGTGVGQSRHIDSYTGGSKTAIVNRDWETNPDGTTGYVIRFDSTKHVHGLESTARQHVRDAMKLAPAVGAPAADSVDKHLDDILQVTEIRKAKVADLTPSTTKFITDLSEATNGFWTRAAIVFTSGQNSGQIRGIKNYTGGTKEVQIQTPLSFTPANDDTFVVIPARKFLTPDVTELTTAIFDKVVEGTLTFEQLQRILVAFVGGKTSGGGTTDINFRDGTDAKNRIAMTVDDNGNRSAVTLDGS